MADPTRVQRKLAAILAADVAAYSRLMGADEEGTLARLKALRAGLIDPAIAAHNGRIVKTTGDGLLVEFGSVVDAMRCATHWQAAMAESDETGIQFRIGVNLGDVIIDGDDIFGDGVNIAARLEAMAEPGGICISDAVLTQTRGKLDFPVDDLGDQALKNIAQPVHVFRVGPQSPHPRPSLPALDPGTTGEGSRLPLPDKPSIAVLPFQNMSGDPEQEYFADGMVEEIITALSRLRWFFVIARNSTFTYKGRAVDVKEVGRELGVRYVLEGSVRKAANRVRITGQLIDATTGGHLWADRFEGTLDDIFELQDQVTASVVGAIEPELYAAEQVRSQMKPPDSLDAWECVIRALSLIGQGTRDENTEAEALCRRAIAIAPGYGRAHSLLAWALLRRTVWSGDLRTVVPEISAELQIAFALDDRDPWAYFAQGILLLRLHRGGEAARSLRRALELNPNFALTHAFLANVLATQGTHPEAVDSAEHALRLSPRDRLVGTYASLAMTQVNFAAGRYPECVTWAGSMIEKSPGHIAGHFFLTAALAMQGDLAAAAEARDILLRLRPEFSLAWMTENVPPTGEMAERLREGLRKAGVPEG
jgi:adenylate cyclase